MKGEGVSAVGRRTFVKQLSLAAVFAASGGCAGPRASRTAVPRAGRLVMVDIPGPELDTDTAAFIRDNEIRAVVLFQRNVVDAEQTRRLTAGLRELMGPGALIAIDQEGGSVIRTRHLPYPPSAMSLGASGDADLAYEVGRAVGRGLKSLGVNWNFAPSLDVNSNPLNPVIADRSFGSDPAQVARLGLAWARGCRDAGVATCVKHFPGHGDTQVDSHLGLPVVDKPMAALEQLELLPFREAVAAGTPAVMTSHIVYPALDRERPATLSPAILSGLLRQAWGYEGVIVTDAMEMRAIAERYGRGEAAVMALRAGADLVLAQGSREDQQRTITAIEEALADGALDRGRALASVERMHTLGERYPATATAYPPEAQAADEALMQRAWAAGLTAYGNPEPFAPGERVLLLIASDAAGGGASDRGLRGGGLAEKLEALYDLKVVAYHPGRPLDAMPALAEARTADRKVLFVSTARSRPDADLRSLVNAARPDLHVALWNPYTILDVSAPAVVTYGFRPGAVEAMLGWLRGELAAEGQLPVTTA